jgi:hypothetical protein
LALTGGPDTAGPLAVVGVLAMVLGCKGFTPKGLPFSKQNNITVKPAEIIGTVCMIIGAAFLCLAIWWDSGGLQGWLK